MKRVLSTVVVTGVLAAFVTIGYLVVLSVLQSAVGARTRSSLTFSVLATAFVAVAYHPVRRRIRRLADRLIHGRHGRPGDALAAFSRRVHESADVDTVLPRIAQALADGTGATRAVVWLASGQDLRPVAAWPVQRSNAGRLRPADVWPPPQDGATTVPVHHEGETLGALTVIWSTDGPLTPTEQQLLSDLAAQAGLAMRNARLVEDLRASRQRIVAAQDAGRRRLERDIHDGAQQRLITLSLALRLASRQDSLAPALVAGLHAASHELQQCLVALRELARGVHPVLLSDGGLGPALGSLGEGSPIVTHVDCVVAQRLPEHVEATAYHVAKQALSAAVESGATKATIAVRQKEDVLHLEVTDDARPNPPAHRWGHLSGLDDRVNALDGSIHVEVQPDSTTVVRTVIPCE